VTVAATCDVCGKGPGFGMSVSYSHRRTRRRWNGPSGKTPKKLGVCTSCLKAGKVLRA
jgi:large subunit ribosomal protein L28